MNRLFFGDNLEILRNHIADDSVDLVYIDPPFNSKRDYNVIYDNALAQTKAFGDTWSLIGVEELEYLVYQSDAQRYYTLHRVLDGLKQILFYNVNSANQSMYAYLLNMGVRLVELRRVLKDTGSLYLHCDQTAGHYLKIVLDAVFGHKSFRNELVWCYSRMAAKGQRQLSRCHDTIFWYSKGKEWVFNVDNIRLPYAATSLARAGYKKTNLGGGSPKSEICELNDKGKFPEDWITIPFIRGKEYLGYPTQKPEALLERIIEASCPKDGVVLDAYCGCGTTIAVAQRTGRTWIGIDITYIAIDLIQKRLIDQFYLGDAHHITAKHQEAARAAFLKDTHVFGIPRDVESARKLARETKGDYVRKEFEKWAVFSVGGVYFEKKGADGGVDGSFHIYDIGEMNKSIKKQCYIQVKSGKVSVQDIRSFDSTLASFNAPIGIFVTLEEPTKPMLEYAATLPKYRSAMGRLYDRITILSIEQVLREDVPDFAVRIVKRAPSIENADLIRDLFDQG
jgi:DNA modification methylase